MAITSEIWFASWRTNSAMIRNPPAPVTTLRNDGAVTVGQWREQMRGDDFESAEGAFARVQQFVLELAAADWNDAAGPIRLRGHLTLDELAASPFLVNAQTNR